MLKEAIQHLQNAGITKVLVDKAAEQIDKLKAPIMVDPQTYKVVELEEFDEYRHRFKGEFSTQNIKDFAAYTQENKGGKCFVNQDAMAARCIFDIGTTELPEHCDHTALLSLTPTAPYRALTGSEQQSMEQQDFAHWLEDWRDCIKLPEDFELKKVIAAVRKITVEAKATSEHEDGDMKASRSTFEQIEAQSREGNGLPENFYFTCKPYNDIEPYVFEARLMVTLKAGQPPKLRYRILQLEQTKEAIAEEFKRLLEKEIGDAATVYVGRFTKG